MLRRRHGSADVISYWSCKPQSLLCLWRHTVHHWRLLGRLGNGRSHIHHIVSHISSIGTVHLRPIPLLGTSNIGRVHGNGRIAHGGTGLGRLHVLVGAGIGFILLLLLLLLLLDGLENLAQMGKFRHVDGTVTKLLAELLPALEHALDFFALVLPVHGEERLESEYDCTKNRTATLGPYAGYSRPVQRHLYTIDYKAF